jgi:hypothetical protein
MERFALPAVFREQRAYMTLRNTMADRASPGCSEGTEMKLFQMLRGRRDTNLTTALERQRLGRTMPGQTAAIAAMRLGCLVG